MSKISIAMAALLMVTAQPALAAQAKQVRVHVTAGTARAMSEAEQKELETKADAERKTLEQARKDLDKSLQAKHGKREKDWPAEVKQQSDEAYRAELRAELAKQQIKSSQENLADSARDLTKSLQYHLKKATWMSLSDAPDQTDLSVEVVARSRNTSYPAAAWILYLKITPVGWTDTAQFAGTPFEQPKKRELYMMPILGTQTMRGALTTLHLYSEAEPYWVIRVYQQGTGWAFVTSSASEILTAFAGVLAAPAEKPQP